MTRNCPHRMKGRRETQWQSRAATFGTITGEENAPSSSVDASTQRGVSAASLAEMETDEALVAAAKAGDARAFGTLINRYHSRILVVALRHTKIREDAEDVAQQTFQKAFVNLHKFEGKSSFSTWLTRIAINESLMLLRRARALREVSIDDSSSQEGATPSLDLADASPNPEVSYILQEGAQILSLAIRQLAPAIRGVLELQLCELSARETACHMGISVSAVKARVFHGRRKLRKILTRSMRATRSSGSTTLAIVRNNNGMSQNRLAYNTCD